MTIGHSPRFGAAIEPIEDMSLHLWAQDLSCIRHLQDSLFASLSAEANAHLTSWFHILAGIIHKHARNAGQACSI